MLPGKKVHLTAVEREDLRPLMEWRNRPDFRKHFREYRELNMAMQERWFEREVLQNPNTLMFSIRANGDSSLLGCCGLVYINWVHRHADLSLYIGSQDRYIDPDGLAADACDVLLDYGFGELGLNKIWTEIYVFDEKKKALYDGFGFHVDGVLRENYFYQGRFWDSYILSLLAAEHRKRRGSS